MPHTDHVAFSTAVPAAHGWAPPGKGFGVSSLTPASAWPSPSAAGNGGAVTYDAGVIPYGGASAVPPTQSSVWLDQSGQSARIVSAEELSDDPNTAVAQTIARMRTYVLADAGGQVMQAAAMEALREFGAGSPIPAAFWYVKSRMHFVNDINLSGQLRSVAGQTGMPLVEVLIPPSAVVQYWTGDCDDYVMLLAALLLTMGVACRFVTVKANASRPDEYSHVYLAAYQGNERIPLDASHGAYPGWETEKANSNTVTEWDIGGALNPQEGAFNTTVVAMLGLVAAWAGWSWLDKKLGNGGGRSGNGRV